MIRVMTYNIQGHAVLKRGVHTEEIATVIRQLRPDVIGLQEVHRNTHRGRSGDQLARLAEATGMELFFGRALERLGGEYGNAVLARGSIRSGRVFPLGGKGEARSLLLCEVEVRGLGFRMAVTHLAAWFRFLRGARAQQIATVRELADSFEPPFILVGDFNTTPAAREMKVLLESARIRLAGEHLEKSHRFSRKRLDYIFTDSSWRTEASWVVPLGPSDHWPLIADLEAG